MLNVNELKKYVKIRKEFENATFNTERFTRKEFSNYFLGKGLTTIKTLEDLKIVKLIDKEKVQIKLEEPILKYFINGIETSVYHIENLSKRKLAKMNVTTQEINEIESERFYYTYDKKALNNYLKKVLVSAKGKLNKKICLLRNELKQAEKDLSTLEKDF